MQPLIGLEIGVHSSCRGSHIDTAAGIKAW
jgi:hypothetical protein